MKEEDKKDPKGKGKAVMTTKTQKQKEVVRAASSVTASKAKPSAAAAHQDLENDSVAGVRKLLANTTISSSESGTSSSEGVGASPAVPPASAGKTKQNVSSIKMRRSSDETSSSSDEAGPSTSPTDAELDSSLAGRVVYASKTRAKRNVSVYGFPEKPRAKVREYKWEQAVSAKFFRVGKDLKDGKESKEVFDEVDAYINSTNPNKKPVVLKGICRRSFIIAMSKILTKYGTMPEIEFQLGITAISFMQPKVDPRKKKSNTNSQHGNFFMKLPKYEIRYGANCAKWLTQFTNGKFDSPHRASEREQRFFELIRLRLPTLQSFSAADFNIYGNIFIPSDGHKKKASVDDEKRVNDIHFLNGLLFLITIVEVLARLYRTQDGNIFNYERKYVDGKKSDAFPVAMAQARSLMLVLTGKISLNDFVGESEKEDYDRSKHRAFFGAVTGERTIKNIEIMLEKLRAINARHNTELFSRNNSVWSEFRDAYLNENPEGTLIEGRSRMYFTLRDVYGSGSESDSSDSAYSDGYDTAHEDAFEFSP